MSDDFSMVNYKEIEKEGYDAFCNGLSLDDNPWEKQSAEAQSWEAGWSDGQLNS